MPPPPTPSNSKTKPLIKRPGADTLRKVVVVSSRRNHPRSKLGGFDGETSTKTRTMPVITHSATRLLNTAADDRESLAFAYGSLWADNREPLKKRVAQRGQQCAAKTALESALAQA
jgi:hypothetical protein